MKHLAVFWNKYSIKQENGATTRKYRKRPMKSEFPEAMPPKEAVESILAEHGRRPDYYSPFQIIARAHSFAEIDSWHIEDSFERDPEPNETYTDQDLLPPEMIQACVKKENYHESH